jgi:Protein of unknown function (DUF2510)
MNDIIKTAQRILTALDFQCAMADAIRERDTAARVIPSRDYQNITRAAIATRIWRHEGRKVLAMHPEIVREVSGNAATTPITTQTDGGKLSARLPGDAAGQAAAAVEHLPAPQDREAAADVLRRGRQAMNPPAGWDPDPSDRPGQRYLDGQRWTEHFAPPPLPYADATARKRCSRSSTS